MYLKNIQTNINSLSLFHHFIYILFSLFFIFYFSNQRIVGRSCFFFLFSRCVYFSSSFVFVFFISIYERRINLHSTWYWIYTKWRAKKKTTSMKLNIVFLFVLSWRWCKMKSIYSNDNVCGQYGLYTRNMSNICGREKKKKIMKYSSRWWSLYLEHENAFQRQWDNGLTISISEPNKNHCINVLNLLENGRKKTTKWHKLKYIIITYWYGQKPLFRLPSLIAQYVRTIFCCCCRIPKNEIISFFPVFFRYVIHEICLIKIFYRFAAE